jgi:hypothetical protein
MQAYAAQAPQVTLLLMRQELPAGVPPSDPAVFYTGLAQTLLTRSQAEGLRQATFRVDSLEGLTVDFRLRKPGPDQPTAGTMWLLRVKQTVYAVQWLTGHALLPEEAAQKQRFLASWRLTQLPATPPTAAEIARFHEGEFRDKVNTVIMRQDTTQTEFNAALGLRIVYGIKWTADGYDLTQRSSTSPIAAFMKAKVIHVHITAVQGNTYWYRSTIDDLIFTGQIQLVP